MSEFGLAKVDEQYARYPKLERAEVQKLLDWTRKQPHLPNITG